MPRRQKKRNLKAPPGIRRKPGRLPEGRPFDQLPPGGEDLPPVDKTGDDILLKIIVADLTSCRDIIRFAGTDTKTDSHDEVNASVTYAVASGVSAILGYTSVDQNDEGASDDTGGSSWYVGATMSF